MKKVCLWAAIAAFATTSCSKMEVSDQINKLPLGYTADIGKQSRSGPVNGTTFPTDDANYYFSVLAFHKESGGLYDYGDRYISDEPVNWNGTYWLNDNTQYWPLSGSLQFVAYAPYVAIQAPDYNATDGMILPDFDSAPNVDLMYTDATSDLTSGTVPLTFKHALTQIYFTVATTTANVIFTIKRIDVQGPVGKGTFKSLPDPTWELSTEPTWSPMQYTPYNNNTGIDVLSTDVAPQAVGTTLMLIPQPVGAIDIVVTYDVTYTEITEGGNKKTDLTKTVTLSGADWAFNQRIKYALVITDAGPNAITYEPTVSTWDAETTGTTN